MKVIPLGNGKVALVDDDVPEAWFKLRWRIDNGYPRASIQGRSMALHHLVMGSKVGYQVDHINGDTLDNRMANLRLCTQTQNLFNQKTSKNNTSGYKGVYFYNKGSGRWRADIKAHKKRYRLGSFKTKEEAALAYNEAALKYHGEYARLNVVPQPLHP